MYFFANCLYIIGVANVFQKNFFLNWGRFLKSLGTTGIVEAQNLSHTVVSATSATRQPLRFHQTPVAKPFRENFICSYHQRFGPEARNCRPGCLFAKLLPSRQASKQQHQENANAGCQWLRRSADIRTVLCRWGIALQEHIFLLIAVPMFAFFQFPHQTKDNLLQVI